MKVAVIPARGGSKRIPRKNIKMFNGRPMIAWSIKAAQDSACFEEILVSTDDPEIKEISLSLGASVPFVRPAELSDDKTGTLPVIAHAIDWYRRAGRLPSHVCCVYPTAPLMLPEFLRAAYDTLVQTGSKFSFGVAGYGHPIQRALKLDSNRRVSMFEPEHAWTRSQDLTPAFHDAGQFCWGTAEAFLEGVSPMLQPSAAIVLPRVRVVDIDTIEDWEMAEVLHKALLLPKPE